MRSESTGPRRIPWGRWTTALTMLAGLLFVGPVQPGSAASVCEPQDPPTASAPITTLVTETTGLTSGLQATEIRWVRWHTRVVYGDSATLAGQVVTEDGAIPDATVDLLAKKAGSDEWTAVASATSDSDTGVFSFSCLRPTATTDYRAVYQGSLFYGASQGDRTVAVARRVPDAMKQLASDRFRFQGSVAPRYRQRPVLLQRKTCSGCQWRTVARRNTTTRSAWAFAIDVSGYSGSRWFRAVVPGDDSFVRSYSLRTWRLTYR